MAQMSNSFYPALPDNRLSRRWGGNMAIAEPAVSGYHFIWFDKLPSELSTNVVGLNPNQIQEILASSCLAVTPPGGTLAKVEFTGLGGVKWSTPGSIDYGTSITLKLLEFQGLPILKIIHGWVKMIRDYRTGVSRLAEGTYHKQMYSSVLYYWTTTPDIGSIEYAACYDGVFPLKDPQDLHASDVETVGRIDTEVEFNVDYLKEIVGNIEGNITLSLKDKHPIILKHQTKMVDCEYVLAPLGE